MSFMKMGNHKNVSKTSVLVQLMTDRDSIYRPPGSTGSTMTDRSIGFLYPLPCSTNVSVWRRLAENHNVPTVSVESCCLQAQWQRSYLLHNLDPRLLAVSYHSAVGHG